MILKYFRKNNQDIEDSLPDLKKIAYFDAIIMYKLCRFPKNISIF